MSGWSEHEMFAAATFYALSALAKTLLAHKRIELTDGTAMASTAKSLASALLNPCTEMLEWNPMRPKRSRAPSAASNL